MEDTSTLLPSNDWCTIYSFRQRQMWGSWARRNELSQTGTQTAQIYDFPSAENDQPTYFRGFWETLCESENFVFGLWKHYVNRNTIWIAKDFFWFSISFHFVPIFWGWTSPWQNPRRCARRNTRTLHAKIGSFLGASPHFRFLVSKGGYKPVVSRINHESGTCSPGFLTIKWDDPSKKGVGMLWGDGICHPWTPAVKDSMFSWQMFQWISKSQGLEKVGVARYPHDIPMISPW